jgi:hypothetical protein
LRHVDWHGSSLGKIQALPKDGRPITNWPDRDQAFKDVTIGVRRVAEKLIRAQVQGVTAIADTNDSTLLPVAYPRRKKPVRKYAAIVLAALLLLVAITYAALEFAKKKTSPQAASLRNSVVDGREFIQRPPFYGVIDLGSKGVKAALFSNHREICPVELKNGLCTVYEKIINTKLVSSVKDGQFSEEGIQEAEDAVKQELSEMQTLASQHALAAGYYVVASSGVAKGKNREALAAAIKTSAGIDLGFIDAKNEGYFGLRSAVPVDQIDNSLYVDIGSGNTKLGCMVGGSDVGSFHSAEIGYGSVSGRNRAAEVSPRDIPAGIQKVVSTEVRPAYDKASMDVPCLRNREAIYWTGGASWATATFTHPEKELENVVTITRTDLSIFLNMLTDGSWNQKHFQYAFPKGANSQTQDTIKKAAENDRQRVLGTFAREDLLAGVSIMKAVLDSSNGSAVVKFVRNGGNFLPGYIAETYPEKAPAK